MQGFYGMKVQSANYGEGSIVNVDSVSVTVKYGDRKIRYKFPAAFEDQTLKTTNETDKAIISEKVKQFYISAGEKKAYQRYENSYASRQRAGGGGLRTAAAVFMTIDCAAVVLLAVLLAVLDTLVGLTSLVSLLWLIPMTVYCWALARTDSYAGTAFKVCTLLFANLISGIMLFAADSAA